MLRRSELQMGELKRYFEGSWSLERKIFKNKDHCPDGIATGKACFTSVEKMDGLHYQEEGRLFLIELDKSFNFSKQFQYDFPGESLSVTFIDGIDAGKHYQTYKINDTHDGLIADCKYLCGTDNYEGLYKLIDEKHFELIITIVGEHKDLLISTKFTRI